MRVDRVKNRISWAVDKEVLAEVGIPVIMLKKELFLVIMMYNKGDQLEVYY